MNPALQQTCLGCIEGSSPGVFDGFVWGIAIMMAMPFFLLLVVGGGLFYAYRRSIRDAIEELLAEEMDAAAVRGPEAAHEGGT